MTGKQEAEPQILQFNISYFRAVYELYVKNNSGFTKK